MVYNKYRSATETGSRERKMKFAIEIRTQDLEAYAAAVEVIRDAGIMAADDGQEWQERDEILFAILEQMQAGIR
jgi:hypothetical protein